MLTSLMSDKTQRSDLLDDWNTTAGCRQPVVLRCELCTLPGPASCQYPWHWPQHNIALLMLLCCCISAMSLNSMMTPVLTILYHRIVVTNNRDKNKYNTSQHQEGNDPYFHCIYVYLMAHGKALQNFDT